MRVDSLVPRALRRGQFSETVLCRSRALRRRDRRARGRARSRAAPCCGTSACSSVGARSAGLKEFPRDHPVAAAKGSDNVIAFTTKRYRRTPLVVQGPGAGADVTAMGVFSDILKLLHYLPH